MSFVFQVSSGRRRQCERQQFAIEWEFGVDASVAVAKIGVGGDLDTTNLKRDIVSFIFGEKGLIADVTWEGSRFKKLDVE